MKFLTTLLIILSCFSSQAISIIYDNFEINQELNNNDLLIESQNFSRNYFTSKTPHQVVDELIQSKHSPLKKEYMLFQLLTEIALQPPQEYHQYVVDLMKKYPIKAKMKADEGPLPVAIFNLNSKALGIENIWLAFHTEQEFNQIFSKDIALAMPRIKSIIVENNRPQWLGIKNSVASLTQMQQLELADYLMSNININEGLDRFLCHVALVTANFSLVEKVLKSNQVSVREYTLRKLTQYLPIHQSKELLLNAAANSNDRRLSTSLLRQFNSDQEVQFFLLQNLKQKDIGENAAFALSFSPDSSVPEQLKKKYFASENKVEKAHILLALKLNKNQTAKFALEDISTHMDNNSEQHKWLESFKGDQR